MADRKVLVKYYPPDFDFEVLQKKKRVLNKAKELQYGKKRRQTGMSKIMNVRMMFPFTLQCASCREFVYVGTKFNSRVERVQVFSSVPERISEVFVTSLKRGILRTPEDAYICTYTRGACVRSELSIE